MKTEQKQIEMTNVTFIFIFLRLKKFENMQQIQATQVKQQTRSQTLTELLGIMRSRDGLFDSVTYYAY
jgi:hypothetical protein